MKSTGMMASIMLGGSVTYIVPLEKATAVMELLADAEMRMYRNVDGKYQEIIVPQSVNSYTIEVKTLPHVAYAKEKAVGEKWMEEESKSA